MLHIYCNILLNDIISVSTNNIWNLYHQWFGAIQGYFDWYNILWFHTVLHILAEATFELMPICVYDDVTIYLKLKIILYNSNLVLTRVMKLQLKYKRKR